MQHKCLVGSLDEFRCEQVQYSPMHLGQDWAWAYLGSFCDGHVCGNFIFLLLSEASGILLGFKYYYGGPGDFTHSVTCGERILSIETFRRMVDQLHVASPSSTRVQELTWTIIGIPILYLNVESRVGSIRTLGSNGHLLHILTLAYTPVL
jgi:hypothetical protein